MNSVDTLALLFTRGGRRSLTGDSPTGPPTSVSVLAYGFGPAKWRVSWSNGDVLAYTRVYEGAIGGNFAGSSLISTQNPGATSKDTSTATSSDKVYYITHYRNGSESTEISVQTGSQA